MIQWVVDQVTVVGFTEKKKKDVNLVNQQENWEIHQQMCGFRQAKMGIN